MKKKLLLCLSILLIATMAIGGSMAYFTDTDTDVNVMLFGNVDIDQIEQEWNADQSALVDFNQAKPLFPYVGSFGWENTTEAGGAYRRFTMNNVIDKYVSVANTGKNDAYVRTIIALEMGDFTEADFDLIGVSTNSANGSEFQFDGAWMWSGNFVAEIDGHNYYIMVATHESAIAPEETTIPSLLQVYLSKEADNEDVEKLDGNGNGTYDILVKSQAVQTAGFSDVDEAMTEAFGVPTPLSVAEWFTGVAFPFVVENYDDATTAFANGGDIYLADTVSGESYNVAAGISADLHLNENKLEGAINNNGDLTVSGGDLSSSVCGIDNFGNATITDVTMKAGSAADYGAISRAGSTTVFENVDIDSAGGGIASVDGAQVTFDGGSVAVNTTSTSGRYNFYAEGNGSVITINDGVFSFSKTLNQKRAYIYAGAGTTVYVNGGTFGKASTRSGYTAGILGEGTVIITGGTFGFNPSAWVAPGYQAVEVDGIWTVTAQ